MRIDVHVEDKDVQEEIPVHLFEDYERESDKMLYYKQMKEEYEWYNAISEGLVD